MSADIGITSVSTGNFIKLKDDVQQAFLFRDRIKSLNGVSLSDDEFFGWMQQVIQDNQDLGGFYVDVKTLLFYESLSESRETTVDKLKEVVKSNSRLHEFWLAVTELIGGDLTQPDLDDFTITKIKELIKSQEYTKESLAAIADCLDLPSDSTQFAIRFGIIKLLEEIERLQQVETGSKQSSQPYTVNVQITGDPTEIAEAIRDELDKATRFDPQEVPEVCDDIEREKPSKSSPDLEVENRQLKQQLSGIASFFGLPSDAKQPEICYAIMESRGDGKKALIERLHELIDRERIDNRNLCDQITDLRHDLLVANKVIARLVGE
jgi:hypothetical protein